MAKRRKTGADVKAKSVDATAEERDAAPEVDELEAALADLTAAKAEQVKAAQAANRRRAEDEERMRDCARRISAAAAHVTAVGAKYRQGFALAPAELRERYMEHERRIGDLRGEVAHAQNELRALAARAELLERRLVVEIPLTVRGARVPDGVPGDHLWKLREDADRTNVNTRAVLAVMAELDDVRRRAAAASDALDAALEAIDETIPRMKAAELDAVRAGLERLKGPPAAAAG